jgi:hypothetical protein
VIIAHEIGTDGDRKLQTICASPFTLNILPIFAESVIMSSKRSINLSFLICITSISQNAHSSLGITAIISIQDHTANHAVACIPLVTAFETLPSINGICEWIQSFRPKCQVVQLVPLLSGGMSDSIAASARRICEEYALFGIITKVLLK